MPLKAHTSLRVLVRAPKYRPLKIFWTLTQSCRKISNTILMLLTTMPKQNNSNNSSSNNNSSKGKPAITMTFLTRLIMPPSPARAKPNLPTHNRNPLSNRKRHNSKSPLILPRLSRSSSVKRAPGHIIIRDHRSSSNSNSSSNLLALEISNSRQTVSVILANSSRSPSSPNLMPAKDPSNSNSSSFSNSNSNSKAFHSKGRINKV